MKITKDIVLKRKLVWLPAIVLMIGIFYFSHQPAKVSSDLSGGMCYRLVSMAGDIFEQDWSEGEKLFLAERIKHPIRKLAPVTEYALLGMAVALGVVYESNFGQCDNWKQYLLIQIIGSCYAASDTPAFRTRRSRNAK